jgi:hypothetical protein
MRYEGFDYTPKDSGGSKGKAVQATAQLQGRLEHNIIFNVS